MAYGALIEGSFSRFCYNSASDSNRWTVTAKDGTKSIFGNNSSSRQPSGSNTFRWFLRMVDDVDGNRMLISYVKDSEQVYPSTIEYAHNYKTGLAAGYSVEFITEDRNDVQSSYVTGKLIKTAKRLKTINVKQISPAALIRSYNLG